MDLDVASAGPKKTIGPLTAGESIAFSTGNMPPLPLLHPGAASDD